LAARLAAKRLELQRRIGALMIAFDTFYFGQMRWMAALADWHAMPTIGPLRDDQIDRSIPDFVNI
jgi:hypothetical protein